ncbi:DUF2817 domain-containing protein [Flavobacteriaceae bacterium TP-CH-4]|uniref:DUF2817 domain-containing protein n=1 Tax=Pelagihabitans pacificus TaxID=2696054 RepID=A0A967E712_9FLAO|nr:M14 metallopeptidase family protein [Pelagihabitans pacificus]NHF60195.1 DUF2817 domain-containing protein [Pelagihabitans pacificus]
MNSIAFDYDTIKEKSVTGRYVTLAHLEPFFKKKSTGFFVTKVGESVMGNPIPVITVGKGTQKILMWSQMHGNESTTTKAVLDLLSFLKTSDETAKLLNERCTLKIIPILNPDGAVAYTRVNKNGVDLNRDAQIRSQPESRALRELYDTFEPNFCFNLHDQRTIFNVGTAPKPATVSFLAPAHDEERGISESRDRSMRLIVAMNEMLQGIIPGQVGRYDDAFNPNCIGDTFQMLQTPTILFEAGHYPGDYQREKTREYIFYALLQALSTIAENKVESYEREAYFEIPGNSKQFFDVLVKNPHRINTKYGEEVAVGIMFKEKLVNDTLNFEPQYETVPSELPRFGHLEYDCGDAKELSLLKTTEYWKGLCR